MRVNAYHVADRVGDSMARLPNQPQLAHEAELVSHRPVLGDTFSAN
jgi:hypothetical protein